jgi:hypothetical protein
MISTPGPHPLDNVIWHALTSAQADWSRGGALARRFRPEFARFAGMPAVSGGALAALAGDLAPGEVVALSGADDLDAGPLFEGSSIARTSCRWSGRRKARSDRRGASVRWARRTCRR